MSFSCFDNSNFDYNALNNKPCVNGCVLSGDMSFEDMGLTDLVNCCTQAYIDECFMPQVECCLSCKQNILTEGLGISILDQGETCQVSVAADSSLDCASENAVMNCAVAAETACLRHDLACSVCCLEAEKQDKLEAGNAINITCCRISVCVDSLMSSTSENPVMNCTINQAIDCIMSCGYQAGNGIDMTTDECGNHVISLSECVNVCCDLKVAGCSELSGPLLVCGDIYQCGSAYCTHAEEVYSKCDCIFLRDGAVSPLGANECSGFVAKKYNGTDDAIIAVDSNGTWRLGETDGDPRQAVATRAEAQDMLDCGIAVWNGAAQCFETASSSDGQTAVWDDCVLPGLSRSLSVNHTKIKGEVTNADKVTMHDYKSFSDLDADIALETGEFSRYDNVAGVSCCFQQYNVHRDCWTQLDSCVQYVEQCPVAADPGDTTTRYEFSFNEAVGTVDVVFADDGSTLSNELEHVCIHNELGDSCQMLIQNIWSDGCCTYSNIGSAQLYFDRSTHTWRSHTWCGYNLITGCQIWKDGDDIYFTQGTCQYKKCGPNCWVCYSFSSACNDIYGSGIWSDGCCFYYSNGFKHCVLNKSTCTWETMTWNGMTAFTGQNVWSDGCCIYYSASNTCQYVLNKETNTWVCRTEQLPGLAACDEIYGCAFVWHYANDTYITGCGKDYKLNKQTRVWECVHWQGTPVPHIIGCGVWFDDHSKCTGNIADCVAYMTCDAYHVDSETYEIALADTGVSSMFTSVSAASGCQSPTLLAGYPATYDDELEAYTATATNSQRRVATFKYEPNTSGSCTAGCYSSSNYTDLPFFVEHCVQNLCYYIDDLGVFCDQCQYYCYDSGTFTYCHAAVTSGTYIPGTYYFQCVASSSSCVCSSDVMFDGSPVSGLSAINNSGSLPGDYSFCVCCQEQVTGETCCMSADTLCCLWDKTHSISEIEAYVVEQTVRLDVCESGNGRDYLVHTYGLSGCYLEQTRTYMSDTATRHCCCCLNNAEWTDWTDLSRQSAHVGTARFLQFAFHASNRKSLLIKADTHIPLKIRNSRTGYVTETRWLDIENDTIYDMSAKITAAAAVDPDRTGQENGKTFWVYLVPTAQGGVDLVVSTRRDCPSDIDASYTEWNTLLIGCFDTLCYSVEGGCPGTTVRCYAVPPGAYSAGDMVTTKPYNKYDDSEKDYYDFYTRAVCSVDTTCTVCSYAVACMQHALACFDTGDILPEAVWSCGFYPTSCCWGGKAYIKGSGKAVNIYVSHFDNECTTSKFLNPTITATYAATTQHTNFSQVMEAAMVGDTEVMDYATFMLLADGSPSRTVAMCNALGCAMCTISDYKLPCYAGATVASNCQRIVSDIGVEDATGSIGTASACVVSVGSTWSDADCRGCLGMYVGSSEMLVFGATGTNYNVGPGPRSICMCGGSITVSCNSYSYRGMSQVVCRTTFPT